MALIFVFVGNLMGEVGSGKFLLLLWHVDRQYLANGHRTLWVDADNNFREPKRRMSSFATW